MDYDDEEEFVSDEVEYTEEELEAIEKRQYWLNVRFGDEWVG